ncbi:MAG: pectate lyase [Isosphaeraceae bacterium]
MGHRPFRPVAWIIAAAACTCLLAASSRGGSAAPDLRDEAAQALRRAASYYHGKVARHGGYVYHISLDLRDRWGEGEVGPDTIVVQPPGTPSVGMAFLDAFRATGDAFYLQAAREAAEALVYGQLESGGWTQVIHFAPAPRMGKYRRGKGGDWNASSLDDDQTQAALRFLMNIDRALDFKHAEIHDTVTTGLDALLRAQFPSGGFPQVWTGPSRKLPVVKASYPDHDWKTEGKIKAYWNQPTLNDGLPGTVASTLILAHEVYGDPRYRTALERLGDFLILAQMPMPQPAWCQQYSDTMVPIWARKFEPPAVSGWESQDAIQALIAIARHTHQAKYLDPIPSAIAYLRRSLLPDGRLARFYELKTNRPLYMDRTYQLTYDDGDVPTHYGWKQPARLDSLERAAREARSHLGDPPARPATRPARDQEREVKRVVAALDDQGRWITTLTKSTALAGQPRLGPGTQVLASADFCRNMKILSDYLASARP